MSVSRLPTLVLVVIAAVSVAIAPTKLAALQDGLKIVVIEGEAGVNIIQQRTAVAPVVEVRDRNDLPIAGVPVTFSVGGANATFAGGLQTVTVTTNAAGRAAVAALNPLASGSVQINVTAAYQGQTISAAITQTNFATTQAAQAAGRAIGQAGQSGGTTGGSSGATGGGGGGLSGPAIAGVAGAAGAAGLVIANTTGGNKAPGIAGVTASPASVIVGMDQPVTFSAQATDPDGDALTYQWDFGDGGRSTDFAPSHVFRAEGSFTVRLTVSDGENESTGQTTVAVRTLTGTWRSNATIETTSVGGVVPVFTLTQSGTGVSGAQGVMTAPRGVLNACPYQGAVQTASPRVSMVDAQCGGVVNGAPVIFGPAQLLLDPGANADTLVGTWATRYPITLIRQ